MMQGIKQFLHIWATKKDIRDDVLKWGDEVGSVLRSSVGSLGVSIC